MHVLAQVKGVDGLDEADHADLKEVVHVFAAAGEALHHREHEPEVAGYELLAGGLVPAPGLFQQGEGLPAFEYRQLRGIHPADLDFSLHQKTPLL